MKVPTVCHVGDTLSEGRVHVEVGTGAAPEEGGVWSSFSYCIVLRKDVYRSECSRRQGICSPPWSGIKARQVSQPHFVKSKERDQVKRGRS